MMMHLLKNTSMNGCGIKHIFDFRFSIYERRSVRELNSGACALWNSRKAQLQPNYLVVIPS